MKNRQQASRDRVQHTVCVALLVLGFFALTAQQCFAVNARLDMVTGTTFTLNTGASFDISGSILSTGTISTAGDILLNGDLNMSGGSFSATGGTVTFRDNTQSSTIYGSNTFNNVTSTAANKTINFQAATTQTVNGTLTLTGGGIASTQTIKLRCSVVGCGGGRWNLGVSAAAHSVSFVDVQDSEVLTNDLTAGSSVNSGNNDDAAATPHWVFSAHATGAVTDTATSIANSGSDDVLKVVVTNTINDASNNIRFDGVNVKFMDAAGTALTTVEAQNLFSSVSIYYDVNGNGIYEPLTDTTLVGQVLSASLSLTAGYQNIARTIAAGDPSVNMLGLNSTKTYFVVVTLSATATSQTKNAFTAYVKPATTSDLSLYNTYLTSAVSNISGTAVTSKAAKAAYWIFTPSPAKVINSSPIIRSIGGTNEVFVGGGNGANDGAMYCLKLSDGTSCGAGWPYTQGGAMAGVTTPIPSAFKDALSAPANTTYIYFGTNNGQLYAVDETGAQRFVPITVNGANPLKSAPSLRGYITSWAGCGSCPATCSSDCVGVFVADGSANAQIWAYKAGTGGASQWSTAPTGTSFLSHPAVNNNELYIGAENGRVYNYLTPTGAGNGSFLTGAAVHGTGFSQPSTNKLWIGSKDGTLYELNTATMASNWSFASGSAIESGISWRFSKLYFGNVGTFFSRFDNNTPNWTYVLPTLAAIKSIPLATAAAVYFTADDGYLYTLDSAGALRANFPASLGTGTVTVNPVAAIGGSRIVVSVTEGTTGKVFCFPDN